VLFASDVCVSADASITIQFGGCDGKIPNCLPIMKGWNYTVQRRRRRDLHRSRQAHARDSVK